MHKSLTYVVDCHGAPHLVRRADLIAKRAKLPTYWPSGKPVADSPAIDRKIMGRPAFIVRESIASVAVTLRKRTALDDRIERRFRKCQTAAAF